MLRKFKENVSSLLVCVGESRTNCRIDPVTTFTPMQKDGYVMQSIDINN